MATPDQINDFSAFALDRVGHGVDATIDELFEEWRAQAFREVDARAVMASVRDLESGERGRSLDEFLEAFDHETDVGS